MSDLQNKLDWQKMKGLVPAIVQDYRSAQVLMLAYMNREALAATLHTGQLTFYSRSKQRLWRKGETSGNTLQLRSILPDCDGDSLLILAEPAGPSCHLGEISCFQGHPQPTWTFLQQLIQLIRQRARQPAETGYTSKLLKGGVQACAQKTGEEAVEAIIAALSQSREAFLSESADLMFHFLVLLQACETDFYAVMEVLKSRHRKQLLPNSTDKNVPGQEDGLS